MLRWMCRVTRFEHNSFEGQQGCHKRPRKLQKDDYGHVMMMKEDHILRRMLYVDISGELRKEGGQTWKDAFERGMTEAGLKEGNTTNRTEWRMKLISSTGDTR